MMGNIGDIAGIGADLHASLVEAICAALVMSATSWPLLNFKDALYFPLVIPSVGIAASFFSNLFGFIPKVSVEVRFRAQLIVSTFI